MKEEQQIEKSPYKWKALKSLKLPNPDNPKVPKTLKLQISNVHVLKIQPYFWELCFMGCQRHQTK